jgi:ribonuclease HI
MAEVWNLPNLEAMRPSGYEWLLQILHACGEEQRAMTLMTLWRIWHAHNEMTHHKPCPSIEGSRRFLVSYLNSLMIVKQFPDSDIAKGKMVINQGQGFRRATNRSETRKLERPHWAPPTEGTAKLNVDGAFTMDGRAGIGMVLRNCHGEVLYAACQQVHHCSDALEAELMAIEMGVQQALQWTQLAFTVESDCLEAVNLIKRASPNISAYAFRIRVVREFLREKDSPLVKINREANNASHELAKLARTQGRNEAWIGVCPPDISVVTKHDCNPVIN